MAKRTGEKYEAIIDAAVQVIAEYGYHNAQISKIAREAKVAMVPFIFILKTRMMSWFHCLMKKWVHLSARQKKN